MVNKIIKRLFFLVVFVVYSLLAVTCGLYLYPLVVVEYKPPVVKSINSNSVWTEYQNYRTTFKLGLLIKNENLCLEATNRAKNTLYNFSHDGYMETYLKLKEKFGFEYVAENLSKDIYEPDILIQRWATSPPHREVLDNKQIKYGCISCISTNCALLTAY